MFKAWLKILMMGQSKMPITKEKQYESQYTTLPLWHHMIEDLHLIIEIQAFKIMSRG
jgi:hypothetical protein